MSDNNKRVFECFYQWSLSILDSYLSSPFPKQSQTTCIKFWAMAFNRGNENRKLSFRMTKRWPRPLNRGSRLIGVSFAVFLLTITISELS